jgi:hypothetical protein
LEKGKINKTKSQDKLLGGFISYGIDLGKSFINKLIDNKTYNKSKNGNKNDVFDSIIDKNKIKTLSDILDYDNNMMNVGVIIVIIALFLFFIDISS